MKKIKVETESLLVGITMDGKGKRINNKHVG